MHKTVLVMRKIRWYEDQLKLAYRYLETDAGRHLPMFRPLFDKKLDASGNAVPPHVDWVKNVFIRKREKAMVRLHKLLRRLEDAEHERQSKHRRKRSGPPLPA